MHLKNILFTGFEPFSDWKVNPTEEAVQELNNTNFEGINIIGKVIPLRFDDIQPVVKKYVDEFSPIAIIMSGQAGGSKIRLEHLAKNYVKTNLPYNCGSTFQGEKLIPLGSENYYSTLPFDEINTELVSHEIPVVKSEDAGTFGCNQIFYLTRYMFPNVPSGFIHVPKLPDQTNTDEHMDQTLITKGLSISIETIAKWLNQKPDQN